MNIYSIDGQRSTITISIAAVVDGDADDSDVVAGDASYVSSSSLLLLTSAVRHNEPG